MVNKLFISLHLSFVSLWHGDYNFNADPASPFAECGCCGFTREAHNLTSGMDPPPPQAMFVCPLNPPYRHSTKLHMESGLEEQLH